MSKWKMASIITIVVIAISIIISICLPGYTSKGVLKAALELKKEELIGQTDNNPYGLRNDVYTYINENYRKAGNLSESEVGRLSSWAAFLQKVYSVASSEADSVEYTRQSFLCHDIHYDIIEDKISYENQLKLKPIFRLVYNTPERLALEDLVGRNSHLHAFKNCYPSLKCLQECISYGIYKN